ncbi:uncharacterized protein LOC142635086 [Castanea sativa]|uniref:uncharacterized protein LOC142635086 n=1 Tax=Castanea sativa TaxID=21020 RepID=UPI003F64DA13
MYFDRAVNHYGNGIGVLLITFDGFHVPLTIKLNFEASNNIAENEACITGMDALRELGVKEVEAASYSVIKAKHVARFIENNIICWFGVPQEIILDNGSHFEGEVRRIIELYNIEHHKSLPYQTQNNGFVEADNKTIKNILAKMGNPYSLVYESETVLLVKVEIQSLRVLVETQVLEDKWMRERYEQLALIDEKIARAQYHVQGYQKRIARAFNKNVKPRNLKEVDLVLKVLRDETFDPRGKMKPRW